LPPRDCHAEIVANKKRIARALFAMRLFVGFGGQNRPQIPLSLHRVCCVLEHSLVRADSHFEIGCAKKCKQSL
jgi:hypothetical protein